jgi:hypothetical protein
MNLFSLDSLYKLDPNYTYITGNKQIEYKSEENLKFERPSSGKNKPENVRIKSANRSRAKNSNALLNSSQVNADVNPLVN